MTNINMLPVPTWNHLAVNEAPAAASLPETPETGWGQAQVTLEALPAGVTLVDTASPDFDAIETGAGAPVEDFVANNANVQYNFSVAGAVEEPLLLTYTLTEDCPNAISDLTIHARANSCLTLVEVVRGETAGVSAARVRILAEENSHVKVVQLQLLPEQARRWTAVGSTHADGAQVEFYRAELGCRTAVCGAKAALSGKGSRFDTGTIYFGDGEGLLDFNDVAIHTGKDTQSEIHAAGVLADRCRKTLRGTIDFRRGAVHAVGHESEDVLLLGPEVRNRTAPLILCGEELVEGQHAATAGRLDERVLYYMAARGLSESEARRLMIGARYAPVLDQIPLANLRCELDDYLERRLSGCEGLA